MDLKTFGDALWSMRDSDKIAVICGDKQITYETLWKDGVSIANSLIKAGICKGDRIAVDTGRSLDYVRMMAGIALCGAIGVNIDRSLQKAHTERIISDSSPKLIVDESNVKSLYKSADEQIQKKGEELLADISGADPYWLIYSSGSTGTPKGSVLCHETVIITCAACDENVRTRYMADHCERILVDGSLSFLAAIFFLLYALCNRKTAVFANEQEFASYAELAKCIERNKVDFICRPNSWISKALENPDYAKAIRNVRVFSMGGEKNTDDAVHILRKYAPDASVFLSYGSSELIAVSDFLWSPGNTDLLGNPIKGVKVYLLDDNGRTIKAGEMGEICVGGRTAELGSYWNSPKLTAEKYELHQIYGRICHTGDMGRIGSDGQIHIIGRKDSMIKLHGVRIEPAYIERILRNFPGIREAAVVAKDAGTRFLCAYYTSENKNLDKTALRYYLADELPYYMIPTYLNEIDSMPLNNSGKLDRNALSELPLKTSRTEGNIDITGSNIEKILCEVFAHVLMLPEAQKAYPNDNFFELGGDSISAMEAVYMLEQEGYSFELKHIYAAPSPRMLSEFVIPVDKKSKDKISDKAASNDNYSMFDEAELEKLRIYAENELGGAVEAVYPVIYSVTSMLKDNNPWMMCVPFEMDIAISRDEWKRCMEEIKDTHESLRTIFFKNGDMYFRAVMKAADSDIFYVDLSSQAVMGERFSDKQRKYFEITENLLYEKVKDPLGDNLFQAGLIRVDTKRSVLLLYVSHLLFDEMGVANLARDILSFCHGDERPKSDSTVFMKRLERLLFNDREKALQYWNPMCCHDRRNIVELRMAPVRKEVPNMRLAINGENSFGARVASYCKKEGVSFAVFVHSLIGRTLMEISKKSTVSFLTVCAGRSQEEIRLAGLFSQSVPFMYSGKDTWSDIQEQLIKIQSNAWIMDIPKFYENVAKRYDDAILLNIKDDYHERFLDGVTLLEQKQIVSSDEMAIKLDGKVDPPPHGRIGIHVNKAWPHLYMLDFFTGEVAPDFVENFKNALDKELLRMTSEEGKPEFMTSEGVEKEALMGTVRDILKKCVDYRKDDTMFIFPGAEKNREISAYKFRNQVKGLGAWLCSRGFRKKRIAVIGRNSAEWILMAYTILCGDSAMVLIDPELSPDDIKKRVLQVGASLVAGEDSVIESLDVELEKLPFSQLWEKVCEGEKLPASAYEEYIDNAPEPESEAVLLFTTGTTGEAKIVALTHRHLFSSTDGMYRTLLNHKNNMTMMITLPLYHIGAFSGMLLLYTWFCARIVVVREYSLMLSAVKETKPGYATLVPRLADVILAWLQSQKANGGTVQNPFVEIALVGTTVSPMYRDAFAEFGTNIIDCYGMTESAGAILMCGTPINGMDIKLLDNGRQGEILVKGIEIFDGYLDKELDKKDFEDGWFHTGDIGTLTDDGLYRVTGRLKNLIILSNGENVSPEEIEDYLNSSPLIRESMIHELEDQLVAEIVPEYSAGKEPEDEELYDKWYPLIQAEVERINGALPSYKRIATIFLHVQPLLRNGLGKLMRNKETRKE